MVSVTYILFSLSTRVIELDKRHPSDSTSVFQWYRLSLNMPAGLYYNRSNTRYNVYAMMGVFQLVAFPFLTVAIFMLRRKI